VPGVCSVTKPAGQLARRARLLAIVTLVLATGLAAQTPPYRNSALPVEARVQDLLGRMTLEEKFWQPCMSPGSLDDPSHDYSQGSFGLQIGVDSASARLTDPAAIARAHTERINAIQRYLVEQTRLGIPIIAFDESLHGLMREGVSVSHAVRTHQAASTG
jgi:beta-glucosidase